MGFGDSMHMGEGVRVKLDCAHNAPGNQPGAPCQLCGLILPHQEVNKNEEQDEGGSSNR